MRYHWAIERSARPSRYGPEGFENQDGLIWIYAVPEAEEVELGYLGLLDMDGFGLENHWLQYHYNRTITQMEKFSMRRFRTALLCDN